MIEKINDLLARVEAFAPTTAAEVEEFRIKILGKKGELTALMDEFKSVPAEQKDEFMAATFHFYKSEGEDDARILTFMYGLDGQMLGVNIGWNVYQDCAGILERNPQIRPAEGFEKIDAEWLASKLA